MNSSPVKGRRSATPLQGGFKKTFLKPHSWSDSSHQPKPNGVCSWSRHMWNMCWSFGVSCRTCSWKGQETWERAAQTCWEKISGKPRVGILGWVPVRQAVVWAVLKNNPSSQLMPQRKNGMFYGLCKQDLLIDSTFNYFLFTLKNPKDVSSFFAVKVKKGSKRDNLLKPVQAA